MLLNFSDLGYHMLQHFCGMSHHMLQNFCSLGDHMLQKNSVTLINYLLCYFCVMSI